VPAPYACCTRARARNPLLWRLRPLRALTPALAALQAREPFLASFLYTAVLSRDSLPRCLASVLANKLACATLPATQLAELFAAAYAADPCLVAACHADLQAVVDRDPACTSYVQCVLFFKGFAALQTHRVAHTLWQAGRLPLALALQSRVSEAFHVDIHPAATLGPGLLLDHATGVVIGETATVGSNVSLLHHVTLGGTGAAGGDRHPKVGDGCLIGAGVSILGPVRIGDGAKIGAGSVVLSDVPPRCTAVGVPARVVLRPPREGAPAVIDPALDMDQTSFIEEWIYII
jgi:serine O-acetyltransferase